MILLGLRHLRKGLDQLFGRQLLEWLHDRTTSSENRLQLFTGGIVAGALTPSSTAVAFLSLRMLERTALSLPQMLTMVLGANVGLTIGTQLLALNLQSFTGAFLLLGGAGFLYLRRPLFRGLGRTLLALGLLYLGLQFISDASALAATNKGIVLIFRTLENYPFIIFILAIGFALLLQTSTAAIGLGIGLAEGGLISQSSMFSWVLGANVGMAITMLSAGRKNLDGRRLGLGNLILKGAGALCLLFAFPLFNSLWETPVSWLSQFLPHSLSISQPAAWFNTLFNLVIGLLALIWINPFARLLEFLVEAPPSLRTGHQNESYLDQLLWETPTLALNQATREEMRLLDELKLMLRTAWLLLSGKNPYITDRLSRSYSHIETMQGEIRTYLTTLGDDNLQSRDVQWKFVLLDYSHELRAIGRLIHRDLADAAIRQAASTVPLTNQDQENLEFLYARTLERIEQATRLLMIRDTEQAQQFIKDKEEINLQSRQWQRMRRQFLLSEGPHSLHFLDLLVCLRRINSHLTSVGYAIARQYNDRDDEEEEDEKCTREDLNLKPSDP